MKRIYLDYAAATPVDPAVSRAMTPYFSRRFGNPGSIHYFGREATAALDESREKIAGGLSADFREIIFTGSATEANNLALRGVVKAVRRMPSKTVIHSSVQSRIIVSTIEHESILETCRDLEKDGIEIVYLPVNRGGIVDSKKLKESLDERTILVSIMFANNETGTIQPIVEVAGIIRDFKNSKFKTFDNRKQIQNSAAAVFPLFHVDAVQAFQFLNCGASGLGVDLMTLSAHKIYGPKGMGVLYIHNQCSTVGGLQSIITGGKQEFGLRSGTENVAGAVGFAKAVELAERNRAGEFKRAGELKKYFWRELKKNYPKAELNSSAGGCLPNIANVYFPDYRSGDFLVKLDLAGVAVSSGAACSARAARPSYVLKACGLSEKRIKSSLRFSFGRPTTKAEISEAVKRVKRIICGEK